MLCLWVYEFVSIQIILFSILKLGILLFILFSFIPYCTAILFATTIYLCRKCCNRCIISPNLEIWMDLAIFVCLGFVRRRFQCVTMFYKSGILFSIFIFFIITFLFTFIYFLLHLRLYLNPFCFCFVSVLFCFVFSDLTYFDIQRLPKDPSGKILFPRVPKVGGRN